LRRRCYAGYEGNGHVAIAKSLVGLGDAYCGKKNYREAVELYKEAMVMIELTLGNIELTARIIPFLSRL
jgi:hypothetical protein